jgi:hypothetical protein
LLLETALRLRKGVAQVVLTDRNQKEDHWMKLTPFRQNVSTTVPHLANKTSGRTRENLLRFKTVKTLHRGQLVTSGKVVKHDSSCILADSAALSQVNLFGTDGKFVKLF